MQNQYKYIANPYKYIQNSKRNLSSQTYNYVKSDTPNPISRGKNSCRSIINHYKSKQTNAPPYKYVTRYKHKHT